MIHDELLDMFWGAMTVGSGLVYDSWRGFALVHICGRCVSLVHRTK